MTRGALGRGSGASFRALRDNGKNLLTESVMSQSQAKGQFGDALLNLTRTVAFITLALLAGIVLSLTRVLPSIQKFGFPAF